MSRNRVGTWLCAAMLVLATGWGQAQEDCTAFNPDRVEARLVGSGWKVVQDGMWMMDFGSAKAEAEKAVKIIKHYRMTQQCFVGRPAPEGRNLMMYFKTADGVPAGGFPGEDAIKFDPSRVEAREFGGNWKVVQGSMSLLDFGPSESNARKAVKVIRENEFHYQCFVGRPNAPMMYFRRETPEPKEDCNAFNPDRVEARLVGSGWKVVHDGTWMMDFGTDKANAEKAVKIIKHYRMTQQCFVGRPAPEGRQLMMYFKTEGGVPAGAFPGEDVIKFDPARVEAREFSGNWKVVQGSMYLLDFGPSEANARYAVKVIKENGFQYQGFVGRPNAPMMYFRKDAKETEVKDDCVPFNPDQVEAKLVGSGWKVVQGGMWMMDFGADKANAEKAVKIIKHYRMTQQCFVGRPAPEGRSLMMYFRTATGIPMGVFPGEDAIRFDPSRVEAQEINRSWKVVQGSMSLLDFGSSEAHARKAVQIIRDNGFQYQCFVGRPNAPMMYFRKDGAVPDKPPVVEVSEKCKEFNADKIKVKNVVGSWKLMDGEDEILDFKGEMLNAMKARMIIRHYAFGKLCTIGGSEGQMMYFKTKKGTPSGSFFGEDAVEFDPDDIEVKQIEGRWKIVDGSTILLDFGSSQAHAKLALETIRKYKFRYQCFVGRPDAPMMYFRK